MLGGDQRRKARKEERKEGIPQTADQGPFYCTRWKEPTYSATMKKDPVFWECREPAGGAAWLTEVGLSLSSTESFSGR